MYTYKDYYKYMAIGSVDYSKYLAMYGGAQGVAGTPARVAAPRTGSTESGQIDSAAVLGVAAQNVQQRTGVVAIQPTTETVAAAGIRYVGPKPEAQPVDATQVTQKFGKQPQFKNVDKVNNQGALFAYMNGRNVNENSGVFDALKSYSNNPNKQPQVVAEGSTNPFANMSKANGFDVTKGLSFAGIQNLDDINMFIA